MPPSFFAFRLLVKAATSYSLQWLELLDVTLFKFPASLDADAGEVADLR